MGIRAVGIALMPVKAGVGGLEPSVISVRSEIHRLLVKCMHEIISKIYPSCNSLISSNNSLIFQSNSPTFLCNSLISQISNNIMDAFHQISWMHFTNNGMHNKVRTDIWLK